MNKININSEQLLYLAILIQELLDMPLLHDVEPYEPIALELHTISSEILVEYAANSIDASLPEDEQNKLISTMISEMLIERVLTRLCRVGLVDAEINEDGVVHYSLANKSEG